MFTCALGFSAALLPTSSAWGVPGQDPAETIAGAGAETSTTVPVATTEAVAQTNQTLVESEATPDQPLFTENRKVAAVIGALVVVALALLLLTIRYWRTTKPVADGTAIPARPAVMEVDEDSIFVTDEAPAAPEPVAPPEPGADHAAADADWEPRTGEHQRVEIPAAAVLARPGVAARRKALGSESD